MANLQMSFEHGQAHEVAVRHFESGIQQAQARFGAYIHEVDWASDRRSARIRGTGYDVLLEVDERHVHATGTIPFFARMFEGRVREFVAETFRRPLTHG